jgi:midasin
VSPARVLPPYTPLTARNRFLTNLLRHPLLVAPILPPSPESSPAALVAAPLLTLDSLLNSHPVPSHWSFPPSIEQTLKSHPSRAIRLLAWRILRNWYGLYSSLGEELKDEWVWKGDAGEAAPLPAYLAEYAEEYERVFGPSGVRVDDDTLPWETRLAGSVQCVEGGISVGVVHRAVDVWVLGAALQRREVEERRSMETREGLTVWSGETDGGIGQLCEDELAGAVVSIEGILLFREGLIPSTTATGSTPPSPPTTPIEPFVNTASTSLLLKSLAHHVQLRLPVLISSPSSAGKSSTIAHLWTTLHSSSQSARLRNLVTINLADRSLDSKSLLGSLSSAPSTASSTAGTFTFIEGPLTRAVRQGRWVVLASIDQASTEVLSVVKVLVERMRSAAIGRVGKGEEGGSVGVRVGGGTGRWVEAGPGFMLFATRSIERKSEPSFFASAFWSEVWIERQGREEIAMIVKGRYERLGELGDRLIGVWEEVRKVREGGKIGMGRVVGVRDLLR